MTILLIVAMVWVGLSLLIAIFGRRFRFGFWGYLFGSILLSPVIGLLLLMAAGPHQKPNAK